MSLSVPSMIWHTSGRWRQSVQIRSGSSAGNRSCKVETATVFCILSWNPKGCMSACWSAWRKKILSLMWTNMKKWWKRNSRNRYGICTYHTCIKKQKESATESGTENWCSILRRSGDILAEKKRQLRSQRTGGHCITAGELWWMKCRKRDFSENVSSMYKDARLNGYERDWKWLRWER